MQIGYEKYLQNPTKLVTPKRNDLYKSYLDSLIRVWKDEKSLIKLTRQDFFDGQVNADLDHQWAEAETKMLLDFCKKNGFIFDQKFTEHLDFETVIEGHFLVDFRQMYRSYNYHFFNTYDIETLESVPFPELYSRPQEVEALIMRDIQKAIQSGITIKFDLPKHKLKETYGDNRRIFEMETMYTTPVYNENGEIVGVFSSYRAREHYMFISAPQPETAL